jgi:beta-lactamase class A
MPAAQPTRREWLGLGSLTALGLGVVDFAAPDSTLAQESRTEPDLIARLAALEKTYDGTFSIECRRLAGSEGGVQYRSEQVLPTASTCKLFILCELFRQAEAGTIDLNAPFTWRPDQHRGGDGVLRAMIPGQQLSVHNLAVLMIVLSDNIATAVLTELVGAANINRSLKTWKLGDSDFHDGLPGGSDAARMKQPVSSARDLCALMTRIQRHEILTPKSCDEIIRILRAQRVNDMLPRYIPVGEDWGEAKSWIANKTGYGECRVDVGLIHTDALTLALAIFIKPSKPPPHRMKSLSDYPPVVAVAHAAKAVYDYFAAD